MAVPPPFPGPAKVALRAELRSRRKTHVAALGPDGARLAAEAAAIRLLDHVPPGAIVSVYLAMQDELDTATLLSALHRRGHETALPAVLDRTTMRFRAWAPCDPIEQGPMNLLQPPASAVEVSPDVIVTPLLGFDRTGGRIGYGAGYYDRAFQLFPHARRIGFAWSVQEVPEVPHDPWDVRLHGIVTEREFLTL